MKKTLFVVLLLSLILPGSAYGLTLIAPEWNDGSNGGGNYFDSAVSVGGGSGRVTIMALTNLTANTKYLIVKYLDQLGRSPGDLTAELGGKVGLTFRPNYVANDLVTLNFVDEVRRIPHSQAEAYFSTLTPASIIWTGGSGALVIDVYDDSGRTVSTATRDVVGAVLQVYLTSGVTEVSRCEYPMIIKD